MAEEIIINLNNKKGEKINYYNKNDNKENKVNNYLQEKKENNKNQEIKTYISEVSSSSNIQLEKNLPALRKLQEVLPGPCRFVNPIIAV